MPTNKGCKVIFKVFRRLSFVIYLCTIIDTSTGIQLQWHQHEKVILLFDCNRCSHSLIKLLRNQSKIRLPHDRKDHSLIGLVN